MTVESLTINFQTRKKGEILDIITESCPCLDLTCTFKPERGSWRFGLGSR